MGSALHPLPSWLLWFCPLPWGNGRCLWLRCHKHTMRLRPGDTAAGGNGRAVKPMAVEAGTVMPGMRQGWRWPWGVPSPRWRPAAPCGAVTAARGAPSAGACGTNEATAMGAGAACGSLSTCGVSPHPWIVFSLFAPCLGLRCRGSC